MYPTSSLFLLGLVAQGIEHRFPKPGVASSNLAEAAFLTTYICVLFTDRLYVKFVTKVFIKIFDIRCIH